MNVLLGRDVSSNFTVTPLLEAMPIDFDLAAARARAVAQRPEIRDARLKEQQAGYDLRLKRFEMYPELSVSFNYLGLYGMQVLPGQIAMLGVQGSWEPWDWGRNTREVAVKSRTLEQARLGVSEAEALISADVSSQLRKVQEAQMLLKVVRLNQESSREKLRVTTEQFRREAALTKDVLQAQTTLSEADQQYQRALAAFWTARADFEKSMGQSQ